MKYDVFQPVAHAYSENKMQVLPTGVEPMTFQLLMFVCLDLVGHFRPCGLGFSKLVRFIKFKVVGKIFSRKNCLLAVFSLSFSFRFLFNYLL